MSGSVMLGAVIATAGLYAVGSARLSARMGRSSRFWKALSGFAALGALAVLELPRFHHLAEELFTFHMIGHIILAAVVAPLAVLAEPAAPLLWSLPQRFRSAIGRLLARISACRVFAISSKPLPATAAHALALWGWHVPALYELAITSELVHWLQHASFLITALLFWSAVFRDRGAGIAILSLLVTVIHSGMLGALLTFSTVPWYHNHDPGSWGLTPLEDQQLAGLIMWVPASFVYLAAAVGLAASLLQESARTPTQRGS